MGTGLTGVLPLPVLIAREGLLPLPLPSPFWHGPALELDDVADPTAGTLTAWRQDQGSWLGFVTWHDRLGFARLTWVTQDHLQPR